MPPSLQIALRDNRDMVAWINAERGVPTVRHGRVRASCSGSDCHPLRGKTPILCYRRKASS